VRESATVRGAVVVGGLLLIAPSVARAAADPEVPAMCRLVLDEESLPTEALERVTAAGSAAGRAEASLSSDCLIAASCVVEARKASPRRKAAEQVESPAPVDPSSVCERITAIRALSQEPVGRLLDDLAHRESTASGGDSVESCRRLLECVLRSAPAGSGVPPETAAEAESPDGSRDVSWKKDFERICAHTVDAGSLTRDQLEQLIADSDVLLARLRKLEIPAAKVYVFRLEKCRDFFAYSLQLEEPRGAVVPER
jgi:hypothetical protein